MNDLEIIMTELNQEGDVWILKHGEEDLAKTADRLVAEGLLERREYNEGTWVYFLAGYPPL